MTTFGIKFFGAIEILRDGEPLTDFRSQKALALLAYLISEGRPITREYLAGLVWPETGQGQALGLLRRTLYNLNQQLPDCLHISQRTIFFKPDGPVEIDLRQFTRLTAQPDAAAWIAAADLYRAPFLEGVYLADCPVFEQWLITEQRRWQEQADSVLTRLIRTLSDQGDYAGALTYANRRLVLAPWNEEAHRQVMRLHLYTGQRSAALAQYERCVAILADELDVEPDEQTRALYAQIKQAPPYPPHNLSPQATPFWGRQTELAELTALIANPSQRLITLVGAGGMGKTRLAIAAAERQLGRPAATVDPSSPTYACFTHGVYLVTLTAIESAGGLTPTIAEALNFRIEADSAQRTSKQQLLDYLRAKRLLLILDNFEQLLTQAEATEATGLLLEILHAAPEVQLLVTSRERLQIMPEQLYPVQGLAYPDALTDAESAIHDYPALALFTQIARHIRPSFRCEGKAAAAVIQICQTVSGMPLAIELAAAAIATLSPAEILAELTHSLDLLATTTRHIPDRHRSMRAAFETSWRQLSQSEQAVFAQLSVFRGGFTRESATAVTAASLSVLTGLANKSFLRYRQRTQRYEIHESLRQFGAEKLAQATDQGQRICQQHSTYFTAKLAQWGNEAKGAQQQAAYQTMAAEAENIRLAWQWAVGEGDFPLLAHAVEGLGILYQWQGRYQEGSDLYQAANQVLCAAAEDSVDRQVLLIKVLTWQATFSRMVGKLEVSTQCIQQSMTLLDRLDHAGQETRPERAAVLFGLGQLARDAGDFQSARRFYEQSVTLYGAINDPWWMSRGLTELCFAVRNSGAIDSFEQRRQQIEESEKIARQSVEICRTIGDRGGLIDALIQLGAGLFFLGRFDEAISILEECDTLAVDLDRQSSVVLALFFLGTTRLFVGRYKQACKHLEQALTLARGIGYQHQIGSILYNLGMSIAVEGRYAEALPLLQESLTIHQAGDMRHEQCFSLGWLAYVTYAAGDKSQARQYLIEALAIGSEIRTWAPLWIILPLAGLLWAERGASERAVEFNSLYLTLCLGEWPQSGLLEDLAGRQIAAIAATLPPAVVAAAQERGRQRNLWETAAELLNHFSP